MADGPRGPASYPYKGVFMLPLGDDGNSQRDPVPRRGQGEERPVALEMSNGIFQETSNNKKQFWKLYTPYFERASALMKVRINGKPELSVLFIKHDRDAWQTVMDCSSKVT